MSHSNLDQPGPSSRPKPRLNHRGIQFLKHYAQTVSANPSKEQKQALLASLRAIPGNEEATCPKITGWFTRHRTRSASTGEPQAVPPDDDQILFPKLTDNQLKQLRVLYRKRTDPQDGVITFWADRLKADKAEMVAWIQYQRTKAQEDQARAPTPDSPDIPLQQLAGDDRASTSVSPTVSEFPRPHLPTPAKSPSISPQTRMPSLPPIAVKVEEPRQCLSPVSSLGTPSFFKPKQADHIPSSEPRHVLEGLPPLFRLKERAPLSPEDSNRMLAANIRDSLRPHAAPSEQLPRTVDQFADRFDGVEKMIGSFLAKYDSGQLSRLGWDSSLGRAVS